MAETFVKEYKVFDIIQYMYSIEKKNKELYDKFQKEFDEFMDNGGSRGNDAAYLYWVGENKDLPKINKYLLSQGAKKGEEVYIHVCW
jgi:hypothetical protein